MKKILFVIALLLISSCSALVAGKLREDRKELYNYHNDRAYCQENPDKCINNIPKY
ncbi:MAG: hypothetical protein IJ770_04395 [Alphaproteobacteria bacterium]|nr:hypothetical protein [Alphaproteobacteria bacterium]